MESTVYITLKYNFNVKIDDDWSYLLFKTKFCSYQKQIYKRGAIPFIMISFSTSILI